MRKFAVALISALAFAVPGPAAARGDHDIWHVHYESWQRPDGKGSCCNKYDCRSVSYRDNGNGIEIKIQELGDTWHEVPKQTVLPHPSFNADAHACYLLQWCTVDGKRQPCKPIIRCVALPMAM
jgi:hypothetical protein